ncbi:hypothetical protein NCCP2716_00910 [Sporosarcina sp. NCCP-2716]|uniref:hypothetical protein n=1 Tax=Sporosarcina sp. NCCP-2716 TaxID=2943679 RepID=UPI00203FCEB2|nr:hypothetical protein [Sporosarcina sp. NCCP-2716]GKV67593.1 hypothetical protein NCCP2716_00910 [Sporosarcina sp. NCCP-2716]
MGYQLPIQPIQSQIYANRMENASPNFAYIDRVQSVKLQTEYEEWQKVHRREERLNQAVSRESGNQPAPRQPLPPAKNGFIRPNPAGLSKEVAIVVGKGMAVNEYA